MISIIVSTLIISNAIRVSSSSYTICLMCFDMTYTTLYYDIYCTIL